jgi:predicted ATPase
MIHLKEITLHAHRYPEEDVYPFNIAPLRHTGCLTFNRPVTFFLGENGTGKSTLLKAICKLVDIHIWEGERRRRSVNNRWADRLHEFGEVKWTNGKVPGSYFSSEIFQNFAQAMDEFAAADPGMLKYFGGKSLITQSHGQSLMSYFRSRYAIEGLYLLDEPETALSPRSQIELLKVLTRASTKGKAQFIVASHSPILLACPGAELLSFDQAPVAAVSYEDSEYFRVYRDFLANRDRFL